MPRVVHFEIQADNIDRAVKFYTDVFGWKITKWVGGGDMDYRLITTGPDSEPGIDGAIMKRTSPVAGETIMAYICTIQVSSVDAYLVNVTSHGGSLVVPKTQIPGIGWIAQCKDSEGNIFGLMEPTKT